MTRCARRARGEGPGSRWRIYRAARRLAAQSASCRAPLSLSRQPAQHYRSDVYSLSVSCAVCMSRGAMCACAWRCACAAALLLLALVAAEHDKRAEMSPMPFLMATRYGRSSPPARHLAPRNDRFFMSTRYGKRSDASVGIMGSGGAGGVEGASRALVCEFTGVFPLYRCRHKTLARYDKRSAEETGEREEE